MRDKYIIPSSLEHAKHQLRFAKARNKKTLEELGKGSAKLGDMLHRNPSYPGNQNKVMKDEL